MNLIYLFFYRKFLLFYKILKFSMFYSKLKNIQIIIENILTSISNLEINENENNTKKY